MEQDVQLGIKRVLFGQPYRDEAGAEQIAGADVVLLTTIVGGTARHQVQLTPEQAMLVGRELSAAAGALVNAEIGDDGKPTSFRHRLARLSGKAN